MAGVLQQICNVNRNALQFLRSRKEIWVNSPLFYKYLFWTNIGISVTLSAFGDFLIQQREKDIKVGSSRETPSTAKQLHNATTYRLEYCRRLLADLCYSHDGAFIGQAARTTGMFN